MKEVASECKAALVGRSIACGAWPKELGTLNWKPIPRALSYLSGYSFRRSQLPTVALGLESKNSMNW